MYVTTHRYLLFIFAPYFDQRLIFLENFGSLLDNHASVLLVQSLTVFLPLHQRLNPGGVNLVGRLVETGSLVRIFDNYIFYVDLDSGIVVTKTALELPESVFLHGFLILLSCILVLWLHLAYFLKILDS